VHGSDSSDHAKEYLDAGFDFVLSGEVETTLLELARREPAALADGPDPARAAAMSDPERNRLFRRRWTEPP